MKNSNKHIIQSSKTLRFALMQMNELEEDLILFVVNENDKLVGTLTDGDSRRGLVNNLNLDDSVSKFMNPNFFSVKEFNFTIFDILKSKETKIKILPIINEYGTIVKLINFSFYYSYLPIDVVIMAGGEGVRLRPLTESLPKPLLKIGTKPIIEHVLDRLIKFGVNNFQISINYLGEKIVDFFKDGLLKNVNINYINEFKKLGTIGSVSLANEFNNDYILIINSDVLTNIDYESFFVDFIKKDADVSIACIPYNVNIPYAILDTNDDQIVSLKEKPNLNFISNAGIYLIKKEHLRHIPYNEYFNATDLIEKMIVNKLNVTYYLILDYWLDIGKLDDFNKAQKDIRHIKL
jgi:dTDP-glucose pyrophosphorylase